MCRDSWLRCWNRLPVLSVYKCKYVQCHLTAAVGSLFRYNNLYKCGLYNAMPDCMYTTGVAACQGGCTLERDGSTWFSYGYGVSELTGRSGSGSTDCTMGVSAKVPSGCSYDPYQYKFHSALYKKQVTTIAKIFVNEACKEGGRSSTYLAPVCKVDSDEQERAVRASWASTSTPTQSPTQSPTAPGLI